MRVCVCACAVSGSAVNNSVGATSQVSLLVSGFVALALMPALAPLLYFLPKPALSIVSCYNRSISSILTPLHFPLHSV